MTIDVGARLRTVRTTFGLSQRELARRAGVTNGLISLIEQNRVSPSVSSLKKLLDAVPMTLAEFFTLDLTAAPRRSSAPTNLRKSAPRSVRNVWLRQNGLLASSPSSTNASLRAPRRASK